MHLQDEIARLFLLIKRCSELKMLNTFRLRQTILVKGIINPFKAVVYNHVK